MARAFSGEPEVPLQALGDSAPEEPPPPTVAVERSASAAATGVGMGLRAEAVECSIKAPTRSHFARVLRVDLSLEQPRALHSTRQLLFELPTELLRGVALASALRGFGSYWRSQASSEVPAKDASRQISEYDAFLSHDWATHGLLKMLALHLHFNGVPAALASLLVGLLVGLLEAQGCFLWPRATELVVVHGETLEMRMAFWSWALSLATFVAVLCLWQRLRGLLGRPLFVFLDKLCISQKDPERKAQGILGLAGFLAQSKSFVLLWSPRYFTRLWCAYEVATWLWLEETRRWRGLGKRRAAVIPVHLSILLLLNFLQVSANSVWGVLESCWFRMGGSAGYYSIVMCGILVNGFINMLVAEGLARDLVELPKQFAGFDVREVQCFCCSVDHVHPDTGEVLPCDRKLVYEGLRLHYGGSAGGREGHLDHFNEVVRTQFAPAIMHEAGGKGLTYWQAWICSGLPYLLAHTRRIAYMHWMGWAPALCLATSTAATGVLVIPTCVKVLNLLAAFRPRTFNSRTGRWLLTSCRALAYAAMALVTWTPVELFVQQPGHWPLVLTVLANLALALLIFVGPGVTAAAVSPRTRGKGGSPPPTPGGEAPSAV